MRVSLPISALCFLLLSGISSANDQRNFSEHEKRIKEANDRIKDQLAPLHERPDVYLQEKASATSPNDIDKSGICFQVDDINLAGVTQIPKADVELMLIRYMGQCIGLPQINLLVEEISNLYIELGFVTTRAYIAPQDLSDGSLELQVIEGTIEGITSIDGSLNTKQLKLAIPKHKQSILNIRDIEQGLENLNQLRSNNVTVGLNPGAQQGGTVVAITNQASPWWHGGIGISNTGTESTGEYVLDANVVLDNLVGINDMTTIALSHNVGHHELPQALSRSISASYNVPYHYWNFSFNTSYYEYEQSVIGSTVDFLTHGSSFNSSLMATNTIYRGQSDKVGVSLSFSRKESKNFIEDVFLDTSSRTIYVWKLATTYSKSTSFGQLSAGLSVDHSVPWFGAKQELAEAEDDFQFTKYQLNLGFSSQFNLLEQNVIYSGHFEYLHSPEVILASEGISIGSRYSVRGFSEGGLFGYRGGYLRNDISLPFQLSWPTPASLVLQLGADIGATNLPEYEEYKRSWIAGSQIGLSYATALFNINFSYAKPLRVPDFLEQNQQQIDGSIRFNF